MICLVPYRSTAFVAPPDGLERALLRLLGAREVRVAGGVGADTEVRFVAPQMEGRIIDRVQAGQRVTVFKQ